MTLPTAYAKRTAAGKIRAAHFAPAVPFQTQRIGCTAAMKRGLKYEAKVSERLKQDLVDYQVRLQPHLRFELNGRTESCFPDVLISHEKEWILVEIKLRHTYDGYNQLTRLYAPVLRAIDDTVRIRRLEVCKTYDPFVELPEPAVLEKDLFAFLDRKDDKYGILIWR